MPLVGQSGSERAVERSNFVAQLYIGRRKVWEGRAATYEQASSLANQEKHKYPNSKSSIVIRESKRGAD